jgi:hypothetical protein
MCVMRSISGRFQGNLTGLVEKEAWKAIAPLQTPHYVQEASRAAAARLRSFASGTGLVR